MVHLCLNMVHAFTLPRWSKIVLLPHITQLTFFSYPTILSSVPTPVINNDRSLSPNDVSLPILTVTKPALKRLGEQ